MAAQAGFGRPLASRIAVDLQIGKTDAALFIMRLDHRGCRPCAIFGDEVEMIGLHVNSGLELSMSLPRYLLKQLWRELAEAATP